MRGMSSLDSGASHQDADVVTVTQDALAQRLHLFLVTQVCCVNKDLSTELLNDILCLQVLFISLPRY
jgi:hypothetical protein